MLLRRLKEIIKNRDWFAIWIEAIIVLVSILIAFQLDKWGDQSSEDRKVNIYFQQLLLDLEVDSVEFIKTIRLANSHKNSALLLLRSLDSISEVKNEPSEFILAIRLSGYIYFPSVNRQTYDELTSTGFLSSIENVKLKRRIASYYSNYTQQRQWDELCRSLQAEHWKMSAGLLTADMELTARKRTMGESYNEYTANQALNIYEKFRLNKNFINILPQLVALQQKLITDTEFFQGDLYLLRESIQTEMEDRTN